MGMFEPVISRTGAAIATQFTISIISRMQDPMPTITPVAGRLRSSLFIGPLLCEQVVAINRQSPVEVG